MSKEKVWFKNSQKKNLGYWLYTKNWVGGTDLLGEKWLKMRSNENKIGNCVKNVRKIGISLKTMKGTHRITKIINRNTTSLGDQECGESWWKCWWPWECTCPAAGSIIGQEPQLLSGPPTSFPSPSLGVSLALRSGSLSIFCHMGVFLYKILGLLTTSWLLLGGPELTQWSTKTWGPR